MDKSSLAQISPAHHHRPRQTREERFWTYVDKTNDCWIWTGRLSIPSGYGKFTIDGRERPAHRVSWLIKNGSLQDNLHVLHHCDNPPCVNPDHLFVGSHQDNMADKKAKGRNPIGSNHHKSKLTDREVTTIRELYASKTYSQKQLAAIFSVAICTISQIVRRTIWKWLK